MTELLERTQAPILVASSDAHIQQGISNFLRNEGYELVTADDGEQAFHLFEAHPLLLAIVDLSLPRRDGLELCRLIRIHHTHASLPVFLLAVQPDDKSDAETVVGLEVGADEYMTWPLNWRVFHARLRALLRRSQHLRCCTDPEGRVSQTTADHPNTRELIAGNIRLDLSGREVWLNGQTVKFSTRLFDLLLHFVHHRGIVLARRELLGRIQAGTPGSSGASHALSAETHDDRLLDVYVHWLREKIEEDVTHPQRIQTVRGIGYRFTG